MRKTHGLVPAALVLASCALTLGSCASPAADSKNGSASATQGASASEPLVVWESLQPEGLELLPAKEGSCCYLDGKMFEYIYSTTGVPLTQGNATALEDWLSSLSAYHQSNTACVITEILGKLEDAEPGSGDCGWYPTGVVGEADEVAYSGYSFYEDGDSKGRRLATVDFTRNKSNPELLQVNLVVPREN